VIEESYWFKAFVAQVRPFVEFKEIPEPPIRKDPPPKATTDKSFAVLEDRRDQLVWAGASAGKRRLTKKQASGKGVFMWGVKLALRLTSWFLVLGVGRGVREFFDGRGFAVLHSALVAGAFAG
jgi:hypothetical protein